MFGADDLADLGGWTKNGVRVCSFSPASALMKGSVLISAIPKVPTTTSSRAVRESHTPVVPRVDVSNQSSCHES